eukprot:2085276-Pleurochrysis_carterae.AAC.2
MRRALTRGPHAHARALLASLPTGGGRQPAFRRQRCRVLQVCTKWTVGALGTARGRTAPALRAAHGTCGEPAQAMRMALEGASGWCRSLRSYAQDGDTRDNHNAYSSE